MKKDNTKDVLRKQGNRISEGLTIGVDLGDRTSRYCVVDPSGEELWDGSVSTTGKGLQGVWGSLGRSRVVMEVGTHSPWVSRLLEEQGHEVIVANARRVRLITESSGKNDRLDARMLARLGRMDPELLSPIRHRSAKAQGHLMLIRGRAVLVEMRTKVVNAARGLAKSTGKRLPKCAARRMGPEVVREMEDNLALALKPLLAAVEWLSERIGEYDRQIEELAKKEYPEVGRLQQVAGVGTLIALTFVLTLEDPQRFQRSRDVGCYLGLRPRQRESGERAPELRITKEGDRYLRMLLVQGAHYIMGPFGPDTDLRRWGLQLAGRGGKNAKKRAVVAVARKLAILLHHLWVSGEQYQPLRGQAAAAA